MKIGSKIALLKVVILAHFKSGLQQYLDEYRAKLWGVKQFFHLINLYELCTLPPKCTYVYFSRSFHNKRLLFPETFADWLL